MTAILAFFKSHGTAFSFLAERAAFDFFARSVLASMLLLFSAAFLFLCASHINSECIFAPAGNVRSTSENVQIVEETKKIALDCVLHEDFAKSRSSVVTGELFTPFAESENFASDQSGGSLPLYAPTVVIKALALLDGESICVLDIDGEEAGKVFKAGDAFCDGQGRVVKINGDGVTWQWLGREYVTGF